MLEEAEHMPEDLLEKQASMEDVLHEVSRIKSAVTDAVDEGVRTTMRALKHGRNAAEDAIDETKHTVKRYPLQAVGIAFAAGLVTGCFASWVGRRRG